MHDDYYVVDRKMESLIMDNTQELKLFVLGLNETELRLLNSIVQVSQRRSRRLILVPMTQAMTADVMILAVSDSQVVDWVKRNAQLIKSLPVIWIEAKNIPSIHLSINRPVQWSQLLLYIKQAIQKKRSFEEVAKSNATNQLAHTTSATSQKVQDLQKQAALKPATVQSSSSAQASHILVVDDSWAVRRHLSTILEQKNYQITLASDGLEAVNEFSADMFDCVLMDVVMPEVDGYEACRQIKKLSKGKHNVPVIMLTSKTSPFDKIRGKMAGCDAYLTKPVSDGLLQQILDKHVIKSKIHAMSNN